MQTYTGEAQVHTQQLASKSPEGCANCCVCVILFA